MCEFRVPRLGLSPPSLSLPFSLGLPPLGLTAIGLVLAISLGLGLSQPTLSFPSVPGIPPIPFPEVPGLSLNLNIKPLGLSPPSLSLPGFLSLPPLPIPVCPFA